MGLIVMPLGVRGEFLRDASMLSIGDRPTITDEQRVELKHWQEDRLGRIPKLRFIRRTEEIEDTEGLYLTNYESIREGKLDPTLFKVISLDEAACLRGGGSTKTFRESMRLMAGDDRSGVRTEGVKFRYLATATPSPNSYIELLVYAAYLDIMDISQAKTRWFKRDSTHADNLKLYEHKEAEFWTWLSTWAIFITKPSDICECECHRRNNATT